MPDIDDWADCLPPSLRKVWPLLAGSVVDVGGALFGGTALAIHLRHRQSFDLDYIEDGLLFHIGRYGNTPGGFELDRIISLLEDPGTFPEDGVFAQDRDRVLAYLKNKAPALRRYLDHEILSPAAAGSEPLDRPDTAGPTEAFHRALRSPDEAIIEPPPPDVGPSTPDL